MKFLRSIIAFNFLALVSFFVSSSFVINLNKTKNEITSNAISSMINKVSESRIKEFGGFSIFLLRNENCFDCFNDLINRIIPKLQIPASIRIIENLNKLRNRELYKGAHALFLNDGGKSDIVNLSPTESRKRSFVLSYSGYQAKISENYTFTSNRTMNIEKFIVFHSQDDDAMLLAGSISFDDKCRSIFRIWNIYKPVNSSWISKRFENFESNFKDCPLFVKKRDEPHLHSIYHFLTGVVEHFAEKQSLKVVYTNDSYDLLITANYVNFTAQIDSVRVFEHYRSSYVLHTAMTFAVSHGIPFTPFEKLVLPFDEATWVLTITYFIAGYLTILITYQTSTRFQRCLFG